MACRGFLVPTKFSLENIYGKECASSLLSKGDTGTSHNMKNSGSVALIKSWMHIAHYIFFIALDLLIMRTKK